MTNVGRLKIHIRDVRLLSDLSRQRQIAQPLIDKKIMQRSEKYMPVDTGRLRDSMYYQTTIGSGKIIQGGTFAPYARYLYYGRVYAPSYPIKRNGVIVGWYSPKKKHPTERKLQYHTGGALVGSHWFERMAKAEANDIAREVSEEIK